MESKKRLRAKKQRRQYRQTEKGQPRLGNSIKDILRKLL